MKRQHQLVLIISTVAFSWLAMQAVHEGGHVLGALVSGGQVDRVILHPATISQTHLRDNPHPLFVVWMGPIFGVVLPLVAMIVARISKTPGWYLFQFFAGFCLVANGAYLALGSFGEIGDAGDMMHYGTPIWLLWLFGLITLPLGFVLWNRLGRYFGLGVGDGHVSIIAAYTMLGLTLAIVSLELVLAPLINCV